MLRKTLVTLFVLAAGGCGATVPAERLAASAAAIRSAEELGAPDNPKAALYLQLAKEQSDQAKKLIDAGGGSDIATALLVRAEADANLAGAMARADMTAAEAKAATDRVHSLKENNP